MKPKAIFVACLAVVLTVLSGCAKELEVTTIADFDANAREFVLLTRTKIDATLIKEFAKRGYRIKKFASTETVKKKSETEDRTYDAAAARYAISITLGRAIDHCVINSAVLLDSATMEISDLRKNDIVLFVEKGGWTENCAWHQGNLAKELVSEFDKVWKGRS
jgi:hypothetical protein